MWQKRLNRGYWNWKEALATLLPYTKLVHIQPLDKMELQRTLKGEETELLQVLRAIKKGGYEGDYLLEVAPNLFGVGTFLRPRQMVRALKHFKQIVGNTLQGGVKC